MRINTKLIENKMKNKYDPRITYAYCLLAQDLNIGIDALRHTIKGRNFNINTVKSLCEKLKIDASEVLIND